ncbi:MAM domain-containing protein [Trichonephila clavipes]|nr:MAM domain-containing protein [Trichonephila clavipes]
MLIQSANSQPELVREDGQSFVHLTGCPNGQCGIAIMQSPWLDPRPSPSVLKLNYKLYGTSSVYLRLYLKAEDEAGQYTLFAKEGNYKFDFPKEWSKKEIILPATRSRHIMVIRIIEIAIYAISGFHINDIQVQLPSTNSAFMLLPLATRYEVVDGSCGLSYGRGSLVVKVSDHGWLVTSSSPVPLKTRRVESGGTSSCVVLVT